MRAHGPQKLAAGQRYRGYRPPGGENATENNTEKIVNSYVWSMESKIKAGGQKGGTRVPEVVDWSQVRYDDYAFVAVDVVPAAKGARTTMTVRSLADALPGSKQPYTEIDRITLVRTAGFAKLTDG